MSKKKRKKSEPIEEAEMFFPAKEGLEGTFYDTEKKPRKKPKGKTVSKGRKRKSRTKKEEK